MTKLQFGLQIYSVRDHCQNKEDMLACLKGLKAMGYNVCQMAGQSRDITPAELRARRLARRNAAAQGREYRIDPEMQALFDSRFEPLAEGEADWVIHPGDKLPDCIG